MQRLWPEGANSNSSTSLPAWTKSFRFLLFHRRTSLRNLHTGAFTTAHASTNLRTYSYPFLIPYHDELDRIAIGLAMANARQESVLQGSIPFSWTCKPPHFMDPITELSTH